MAKASGVLSKSEAGITDIATDILAAHNEATIEAYEGRKKFVNDRIDEIITKTGVVPTDAELDRIEEDSKDLYTKRYGLNLAIVSASNISQFGNAFKTRTQNTIERFNKIKDTLKKEADDVYSYEAPKISKYRVTHLRLLRFHQHLHHSPHFEAQRCLENPGRFTPAARWTDHLDGGSTQGEAWDDFFVASGMDAVRGFGGNVWVVWNPATLIAVSRLTHREAIRRLCAEFDEDGPECGYNGVVSDYASLWWGQDADDPNLTRFPEHRQQLTAVLERFIGRVHSTRT